MRWGFIRYDLVWLDSFNLIISVLLLLYTEEMTEWLELLFDISN